MKNAEVYAKHMNARTSLKRVAPVMDLVRGKSLHDAKVILSFDRTKAAKLVLKVLKSAEANAKNNKKLDTKNMYVSEVYAGNGPISKWGDYKGRGRISRILKRRCHIYVGLSERVENVKPTKKVVKAKKSQSPGTKGVSKKTGTTKKSRVYKKPSVKKKKKEVKDGAEN